LYNGLVEIAPSDEKLAEIYEGKWIHDLKTNQYLIIKDKNGKVIDKRRWDGKEFRVLKTRKIKGFAPKTVKQECLADLLLDMNVPIKIICGVAGSGKSKMSIMYGLSFLAKQEYNKIFVIRHNVGVGEKNGYLPGDKFEKIKAWLGFFEDNIEDSLLTIEDMRDRRMLDTDAVEFIKGRDLKNSWIIVDECEDLTQEQFKLIGERVSEGSCICFVGDYEQTTQDKFKNNSGIKRALENLAGNPLVGIIVFDDKENDNLRSGVSKVFSCNY
jgi:PhoH-like ATPase